MTIRENERIKKLRYNITDRLLKKERKEKSKMNS